MVDRTPPDHPAPADTLRFRATTVPVGRIFHRFHVDRFHATQFNDTALGNARFSPIRDEHGNIIPTLYGAQTLDCAAMETILRDMAFIPAPRHIDLGKFRDTLHSVIQIEEALELVDLTSKSLAALSLTRRDLIDTDGTRYPYTRGWAEVIYQRVPTAQGLSWVSRQDDTAQVIMLFKDRISPSALSQVGNSTRLLFDEPTYSSVLDLLDQLGAEYTLSS